MDGEAEILALLGKLLAQWNYAEHCSRQIIRKRIVGGHVDDKDHIYVSKQTPKWMEDQLLDDVLPRWHGSPGEPYLETLIAAFSSAREYRNHYVHGVFATFPATPAQPAQAIIIPSKPHKGKTQAPGFATADDIRPVAFHIEALGAFACDVNNAFDVSGQRAQNKDGSIAVVNLPTHIKSLPPFPYEPLVL